MRRNLVILAVLAAGFTMILPGEARQMATSTAAGGTNPGGAFFGGFMPSNIVNKPINVSGAAMPMNLQQAVMPQQQSTKVFNINSAFRNVQMPLFRSHAPNVPIVQPGQNNPIQPTNPITLPPVKVQPSTVAPWYR